MRALLPLCLLTCAACAPLYGRCTRLEFAGDPALEAHGGVWRPAECSDAPSPPRVWLQDGRAPGEQSSLALLPAPAPRDADARVQLRALDGQLAQGGGLVWRARDARNYYAARWNPLDGSLRVFKVLDGKRTQLAGRQVQAGPGWHRLRVWFLRDKFEVWLDGQSLGEHRDESFAAPGQVGLWTEADARTQFDDLEIQEL